MRQILDPMDGVRQLFDERAGDAQAKRGFMAWLARRDWRMTLALLAPIAGGTALDVGCGHGTHARSLGAAGMRVCAVDLAPLVVDTVRPFVDEARVGRVGALGIGRRFDRILCFGVLDFVDDPEAAIADLAAHLCEGGRLVVEVPRWSVGGVFFRLAYWALRRIWLQLYTVRTLDRWARAQGLRRVGRGAALLAQPPRGLGAAKQGRWQGI